MNVPCNLDEHRLKAIIHDHNYSHLSNLSTQELAEVCALDHSYAKPANSPQLIVKRPRYITFVVNSADEKYKFQVKMKFKGTFDFQQIQV